jgi:hypothetical protein
MERENVFKQCETFLPTQKLDEISRYFVGKIEHWAATDFIHAAKNFRYRILTHRLSEEEGSPYLVVNELQSILDVGTVLPDSTDLGASKDEYSLSLFSLSRLLRIAETLGQSDDDIPPSLPFAVSVLTRFTFWKLAVNSKQLSVEPRKILLTLAFRQFKYEYLSTKLRQVGKRMKPSGVATEPLQEAEESQSGTECSPGHMMVSLFLREAPRGDMNTLFWVSTVLLEFPRSIS